MLHPRPLLSLVLSALSLCGFAQGKQSAQLTLFVGTYTEDSPSEGIYVFHFNQEMGHFSLRSSAKAGNPSFVVLSPNGNRLYAVSEMVDKERIALTITRKRDVFQTPLSSQPRPATGLATPKIAQAATLATSTPMGIA